MLAKFIYDAFKLRKHLDKRSLTDPLIRVRPPPHTHYIYNDRGFLCPKRYIFSLAIHF